MSTYSKYKISRDDAQPLYCQLKSIIKGQIKQGILKPGTMLTSERKLCEIYNISYITVRQAMTELSIEGFVDRVPGRGTFVANPKLFLKPNEVIGIVMRTSGHIYGKLSKRMIRNLEDHKYYCIIVEGSEEEIAYAKISSLIDRQVEILVGDGHEHFPFKVLDNYQGEIIFINRNESENEYTGSRVLSDYYKGGKLVAEHYLSRGFEKIIYVNRFTLDVPDLQNYRKETLKGAVDVLKEHGLPAENLECIHYLDSDSKIREILSSREKPMAVWASTDANAKAVYAAARDLGLRIPEDVSVIGYFNTPWCGIYHPELTSVSIREEEIADRATDIITGNKHEQKIYVDPELIVRESA